MSLSQSDESKQKITIEEIVVLYIDNYIDLSKLSTNLYKTITTTNIPSNIKYLGKLFNFDLWLEDTGKIILISFPNSPIKSWYKVKTIEDLNIFITYFNNINNLKKEEITLYINNNYNFESLMKLVYFNNFTDKYIFTDLTERRRKLTDDEKLLNLEKYKQSNHFYIYSLYSNSLLLFSNISNHYIVTIKYNKLNLRNRYDSIDKYIPSDVNIILNNFTVITTEQLVNTNIDKNIIDIIFKLETNKVKLKELLRIIINRELSNELKLYISEKINEIEIDDIFNKTIKDGLFKAFENSLDILLKTVYEKLSSKDYDTNIKYINDKLKFKIINILDNKLI